MRVTTLDDGIVRHILLDSPKDHNALSPDLLEQLQAALDGASSSAARVIRLGPVGPTFCSGMDLRTMVGNAPDLSPLRRVLESLSLTRQPTVATVSGHVRAGGIGIMAACDVVFVARHTDFAFTETKLGAIPALISGPLFKRVAPHLISRYYLSGEVFDAETAYNMGLVTEAVDDPTAAANDWAAAVAAAAPGAVSATLELLRQAVSGGLPTLRALQELSERTFAGAEAQEGIRALLEKRKPVWGAFEAP